MYLLSFDILGNPPPFLLQEVLWPSWTFLLRKLVAIRFSLLHSVQTSAHQPQVKKGLGSNRSQLNLAPSIIVLVAREPHRSIAHNQWFMSGGLYLVCRQFTSYTQSY